MLKTRCIYTTPEPQDGVRISIMSRHTLSDGVTPDPAIVPASYHLWVPELGPPPKLIGDHYKRNLPWEQFEARYLTHLQQEATRDIRLLIEEAHLHDITLLCCEPEPEKGKILLCHRRLLAEYCKELEPKLEILVR